MYNFGTEYYYVSMKSFDVPVHYRSPLITTIKQQRKGMDKMKKDFEPTQLQIGSLSVIIARHFGFCYGVENAIEIAFRAVSENVGKQIYLLSEMIHNPQVNKDLEEAGVKFIMDTYGNQIIHWDTITSDDIVIIPAFGTTIEIEELLKAKHIQTETYNTTCPFVEKVWNRSEKIGNEGYTIVVHGKPKHEETRATFSHSKQNAPTVVVNDMMEAQKLAKYITKEKDAAEFYEEFKGQYSLGFDVDRDLERIGVVNQTTMLASDTQGIADYLKQVVMQHYNLTADTIRTRFAENRDTLCYATNDNQSAVTGMLEHQADFALVIGGYNSSNTSHLVELCETILPTFFINHETCLQDEVINIKHFNFHHKEEIVSQLPVADGRDLKVMITSGASCPDALVERIIERLALLTGNKNAFDAILNQIENDNFSL